MYPDVSLVGPVGSCEIDSHVQSWTLFINRDVIDATMLRMEGTCAPAMNWDNAVILGEVGLSSNVLDSGKAFATFYPKFERFTRFHREAIKNGVSELRSILKSCRNVLADKALMKSMPALDEMVLLKFGGEIWRQNLLPHEYLRSIINKTEELFGDIHHNDSCYPTPQSKF